MGTKNKIILGALFLFGIFFPLVLMLIYGNPSVTGTVDDYFLKIYNPSFFKNFVYIGLFAIGYITYTVIFSIYKYLDEKSFQENLGADGNFALELMKLGVFSVLFSLALAGYVIEKVTTFG